jgi:hypothetical protein
MKAYVCSWLDERASVHAWLPVTRPSGNLARRNDSNRRLLAQQSDLVTTLVDRDALAVLPVGSLGRAYLDFERENISAAGIRAAADQGMKNTLPAPLGYVSARMRDTHDLWLTRSQVLLEAQMHEAVLFVAPSGEQSTRIAHRA